MNIKVCGITEMKQVDQLDGLDIDFVGFIFHSGSPRYVGNKLSTAEIRGRDLDLKKVGVFVNADIADVLEAIDDYQLDAVQLHGDELPGICEDLSTEVEVIKAFCIRGDENIDRLVAPYDGVCDYYLFDSATGNGGAEGGTGTQFNWDLLIKARIEKPFFLSGGIGPEDARKIREFRHPDFFGVDINSRFETAPGVKDMAKILQFRQSLRQ